MGAAGQGWDTAVVDQAKPGCRAPDAVVDRPPAWRRSTGQILVVGLPLLAAGGPRPRMMPDSPEAAVPRSPSCPDRRLRRWSEQSHARTLPQREAQHLPTARVLPGTPESAGLARQLAREFLGEAHPDADVVVLIVSELVTNAVTHSKSGQPGGTLTVSLCNGDDGVFVQVRDDGGAAGRWQSATPGSASEHGYGLLLVDVLADSWGTACDAHGRVTWCRVRASHRTPGQGVVPEPGWPAGAGGHETTS